MCILTFFDQHAWIATFLTILSTVGLAAWQINRQFRNTIASQRANKLEELRVQIYKEIAEKIEICQTALSKSYVTTMVLPSFFEIKSYEDNKARAEGLPESSYAILQRYPAITAELSDAMQKLAEVLFVMDKYEIAFNDFTSMKIHIRETSDKLTKAMSEFHNYVLRFLPMDVTEDDRANLGGAKVINPPMPDAAAIAQIRALSEVAREVNLDLTCYLHDLRIEAQNVLLSPIFDGKQAPKRVPGDPRFKVLTLDANNEMNTPKSSET